MENPLKELSRNIIEYVVNGLKESDLNHIERNTSSTLIRLHSANLTYLGDASFSCKPEIWLNYFQHKKESFRMLSAEHELTEEDKLHFLETAKQWNLPVHNFIIKQHRCHLYLRRVQIIEQVIGHVLCDSKYGYMKKSDKHYVYVYKINDAGDNLTHYRVVLMHNILRRLLPYSKWSVVDEETLINEAQNVMHLDVHSVALKVPEDAYSNTIRVKCGLVIDPANNKKVAKLSIREYQSLRSNDMCLMALHKYGVRVKQDERFRTLMEQLGSAAVTVDLMEVKHTSPVQIIRCGRGSSKGASFILYNSARLETLLRTFEERIVSGEYEPLPAISCINWELLNEEEEWQLLYVYLLGFPDLIEGCLNQLEQGLCAVNLITKFLQNLVGVFSVYYHRIRILTQRREHLMPTIYARIYLIKAVREVLNNTLALLGIEPVDFM